MSTSEALLTAVAVRLAMLVAAALVARTLPDYSHHEFAYPPMQTVGVALRAPEAATATRDHRIEDILRDMRLHD